MLIRDAELGAEGGGAPVTAAVRLGGGAVVEIGSGLEPLPGEPVLEAAGGALLPGLHDHHLHLFAMAAAMGSVRCGPPQVADRLALIEALAPAIAAARAASGPGREHGEDWIRGVGYHESVAGPLDRDALDTLLAMAAPRGERTPARVQHRSGAMWVLSTAALVRLGLEGPGGGAGPEPAPPGAERDDAGRLTGRLFRCDDWIRGRLERGTPPDLAPVGARLARGGVTGVTDTTPGNGPGALRAFLDAIERGALPQRLVLMGDLDLPAPAPATPRVVRGAVKLILDERELPTFDDLVGRVAGAHGEGRAVAVHCVTRAELVLACAALEAAGPRAGDRIEHAAVAPPDAVALLAALGVTVVTQPHFVAERGDAYLVDVDERDRPWLYRCRGFDAASVPLGGGTDAPFGEPDPWAAMRAAVDRRTAAGATIGPDEGVDPERALALFTTDPAAPGGAPRRVQVGAPADLCLLDRPWSRARDRLSADLVRATIAGGALAWSAPGR